MSSAFHLQTVFPHGQTFRVLVGDLLDQPVDVIVNAANGMLAHGGGVAAAIAAAAGDKFNEESREWVQRNGYVPTGGAAFTSAGRLPFKGVIHVVGPQRGEGDEEALLIRALAAAFTIAQQRKFRSLAFPGVSSGIFAVAHPVCARAYLNAVRDFFAVHPDTLLGDIRLALFSGPLLAEVDKQWASFWTGLG